jgi:hypothetical protein
MKLAALPTLRILFEPAGGGVSIGKIAEAWDRPAGPEPPGDVGQWFSLSVKFAAQRIARDGLQPELLTVAEEV